MAGEPTKLLQDEVILSRDDLAEYQRQLSLLSDSGIEQEYQRSWEGSRYDGRRVAAVVQQLVAAWRALRRIRKRR